MQAEKRNSAAALVVKKEFSAPIELVFNALAEPDALSQWWGPRGFEMTVTEFNFLKGGTCRFKMKNDHAVMWAKFVYAQIKKPELVEFILSFTDENGTIIRAPFFENWPLEILNSISLEEKNGKTTLTNTIYPVNATKQEISSFNLNKHSLQQGFGASLEALGDWLIG